MASNAQKLLDNFLVQNADFERLTAQLGEFNLFQVLRIERAEIRHSNVLAWLLDPSETHGLASLFLRRFVASVLLEHDVPGVSITPAEMELMPIGDVEVYRERHHIDVLVRWRSGRGTERTNYCLLIENKVGSKESAGQLAKYRQAVMNDYPDAQVIPILLTLDGDDPSDDGVAAGFVPVSHMEVLEIATSVVDQHRTRIPADAQVFLSHYLHSLRRLIMEDPEIVELCKRIYQRHREAIDLIIEHGTASEVYDHCTEAIASLVDCEFTPVVSKYRAWFLPKELGAVTPSVEMAGWKFLPRPLPACFWLRYSRKKLRAQLSLEIGPIANPATRIEFLKAAAAAGIEVKPKQFETAKYARLITESMPLQEDAETGEADESPDYIRKVCSQLWLKIWPKAKPIADALKTLPK